MEVFLPGFGHFYVGKYFFGAIKLLLAIGFISTSIYLYWKVRVAGFINKIWAIIINNITDILKSGNGSITLEQVAQSLFNITFHPFWIFWVIDLYMYSQNHIEMEMVCLWFKMTIIYLFNKKIN